MRFISNPDFFCQIISIANKLHIFVKCKPNAIHINCILYVNAKMAIELNN